MPKLKSALTLQKICLQLISRHLHDYLCAGYISNLQIEDSLSQYKEPPFHDWPSSMIQELIDEGDWKDASEAHQLHLLLHSRITRLNLCRLNNFVDTAFAKSIAFRCMKLTQLNLRKCRSLTPKDLTLLFPSLPLMMSIDLSHTCTTDGVLVVIGKYCPNLRDLFLSSVAGPISDSGISALLGCRLLRSLNISGVDVCEDFFLSNVNCVTCSTLVTLIRCCEDLDYLICANMYGIMRYLFNFSSKIKLITVHDSDISRYNDTFECLIRCMPCIESLSIGVSDVMFPYFDTIKQWKHLKELIVYAETNTPFWSNNIEAASVFFQDKLQPLLEIRGNQITSLYIPYLHNMNLIVIGNLCVNLVVLYLNVRCNNQETDSMQILPLAKPWAFLNLKLFRLSLLIREVTSALYEVKQILMRANNLKRLGVYGHITLDSDALDISSLNSLLKLEEIKFSTNAIITKEAITSYIYADNNLKRLHFVDCKQITQIQYETICKEIKIRNLNLEVTRIV